MMNPPRLFSRLLEVLRKWARTCEARTQPPGDLMHSPTLRAFSSRLIPLRFLLSSLTLSALLAACTLGPNYSQPDQNLPTTFKSTTQGDIPPSSQPSATTQGTDAPNLRPDWWVLFGDQQLNDLETTALANNQDIKAAMARVEQGRATAKIAKSAFYPTLGLDPSITEARTVSRNGPAQVGTTVLIPFDMSYEVDIWGRVKRSTQVAVAQARATIDDFHVILHTLQADVANDYFTIRLYDSEDKILVETIGTYRRQVDLIQKQLNAGLIGRTDLIQAQVLLNAALTQEIDIRRQRADQEHALAILLGFPPSNFSVDVKPLDLKPPIIPPGLPAEILRRRPDVAEAEENLRAANAQIGANIAQTYPTLQLTGMAGFESFDIQHAVDWEQRIWSIGPSVTFPIFEGGRLQGQIDQARARYTELLAVYRTTVLGAIRDVEDSLVDLHLRAQASESQDQTVKLSAEYLRLSELQYRQGLVNYLLVIDADRTLLSNQLTAVQILQQRLVSTVLLAKAIGGGWDVNPPVTTQPSTQPSPRPIH